jgi:hypothetical protein
MLRHDAFRILGVPQETPEEEVRATYRDLVKQMHPDARNANTGAPVDLGIVVEAYRTIIRGATSPSAQRRAYPGNAEGAPLRKRRRRTGSPPPERLSAASIASLGRFANSAADPLLRSRAVAKLASSGRHMAGVYIRQAVFDADRGVAAEAAAGLVSIPGVRTENEIIGLFDQLSAEQRLRVLDALVQSGRTMPRLIAYASADPHAAARRAAEEILR